MTSLRRPSIVTPAGPLGELIRQHLATQGCMYGLGKPEIDIFMEIITPLNTIIGGKDRIPLNPFYGVYLKDRTPPPVRNGYNHVGTIVVFTNIPINGRHTVAYIQINSVWYNADNEKGVLLRRLHGAPTWKTPYWQPGWNIECMTYFYVKTECIGTIANLNENGVQGLHSFGQSGSSCGSDALQAILILADGFRDIFYYLCSTIVFPILYGHHITSIDEFNQALNTIYQSLCTNLGIEPNEDNSMRSLKFLSLCSMRFFTHFPLEQSYTTTLSNGRTIKSNNTSGDTEMILPAPENPGLMLAPFLRTTQGGKGKKTYKRKGRKTLKLRRPSKTLVRANKARKCL